MTMTTANGRTAYINRNRRHGGYSFLIFDGSVLIGSGRAPSLKTAIARVEA